MSDRRRLGGVGPALALIAAGVLAGGPLGAAIVAVAGLAVVLAIGAAFAPGPRPAPQLKRTLPPLPPSAGDDVEVRLAGRLPLGWPLALARVEDAVPRPLGGDDDAVWRLGGRLAEVYTIPAVPRGRHTFSTCRVTVRDGLGLAARSLDVPLPGELLVYPRRCRLDLGAVQSRPQGGEELVRGTREFAPGDRPSRLHAARSAQLGYPQVREFEPPRARQCIVALACPGATAEDAELGISVAASLAEALLEAGHDVGLRLRGRELAPEGGPAQLERMLGELADADPGALAADDAPLRGGEGLWLVLCGSAAHAPAPGGAAAVLRVGRHLDGAAVRSLEDLAGWAQGAVN